MKTFEPSSSLYWGDWLRIGATRYSDKMIHFMSINGYSSILMWWNLVKFRFFFWSLSLASLALKCLQLKDTLALVTIKLNSHTYILVQECIQIVSLTSREACYYWDCEEKKSKQIQTWSKQFKWKRAGLFVMWTSARFSGIDRVNQCPISGPRQCL